MTDHPNVEIARRGYKAFADGDMETLNEIIADDISWHVAGDNIISGDYEGKEAVFGFFGKVAQETGGTFQVDVHDLLANDEHGVALLNLSGDRGGKTLEGRAVHVFHMKDGMLTEFWSMQEDQAAVDEFWS